MDASAVSSSETSSNSPAAAKRPKLESPADEDEDISIIVAHINVRLPHKRDDGSTSARPSQLSDDDAGKNSQDSKVAEFRNKMLKYEKEASHLRTQLKREQEKAQKAESDKVKAVVVMEHYEAKYEEERKRANDAEEKATSAAEQKVASAKQDAKDHKKQCKRLETKVQSKEAEIDLRDKELANAAKELNEAKKKAEDAEKEAAEAKRKAADAEQLVTDANEKAEDAEKEAAEAKKKAADAEQLATDANARAAAADAKNAAMEKETSELKPKLEELKKSKTAAERKLKAKVTEFENRLVNTEAIEQPSSSTDEGQGEGLCKANKLIAQKDNEITKLLAEIDKLKKDLKVTKAKATRLENDRKRKNDQTTDDYSEKDDEIRSLKEQNVELRYDKDEEIRHLEGIIEDLQKLAYPATLLDARLPTARVRQAVGRFDGISERIVMKCDRGGITIKSNPSRPTLPKVMLELKPSFFEKYDCSEECSAQTDYSLLLKGFASQTEKEQCWIRFLHNRAMGIYFKKADERLYGPALLLETYNRREWSRIEDNTPYACTFEMNSFVLTQAARKLNPMLLDFSNRGQPDAADFSDVTPGTNQRIYVDSKYVRRCIMASSGASSKTVEVAMSKDTLRLRYGNEQFSLTYYIPTVKPAENGERCYSPIEFGHEVFEL